MTFCLDDFDPPPMRGKFGQVQTADGLLQVTGLGMVHWIVVCSDGTSSTIEVPAHYVENGHQIRLFSPGDYARYHNMSHDVDSFAGNFARCWMKMADSDSRAFAYHDGRFQVPLLLGSNGDRPSCSTPALNHGGASNEGCGCGQDVCSIMANNVLRTSNINLTSTQKELLLDHYRVGHYNLQDLQRLYRQDKENLT